MKSISSGLCGGCRITREDAFTDPNATCSHEKGERTRPDKCPKCGQEGGVTVRYEPLTADCPGRVCWKCGHSWYIEKENNEQEQADKFVKVCKEILEKEG